MDMADLGQIIRLPSRLCPKRSKVAFEVKDKIPNFICKSQFARFYLSLENIMKVKSTGCKVHRTDLPYVTLMQALREKCPSTEFFLVRIFLYSVRIQENTDQK